MAVGDVWLSGRNPNGIYKSTDGGATWGSLIATPSGQRSVGGVAIDPRNGDVWIAGANPDGLYKSTDGGATWGSLISPPSGQTVVLGVAIDARNGDVWLAGAAPNGIYKSTDGGATWGTLISPPDRDTAVEEVAIDPRNGDVWLASANPDGLYKSTDGGATWGSLIAAPSGQTSVLGVAIDARNGDVWLAGTSPDGIYKSTDGGATWGALISPPAGQTLVSDVAIEYTWPIPPPPITTTVVANAGADRTVTSDGTVQIGGDDTVTNGVGATTISWSRVSGTGGSLDDTTIAEPTFTAPTLSAGDPNRVITWRKTVENNSESDTDDVAITVTAPGVVTPTLTVDVLGDVAVTTGVAANYSASLGGTATGASTYQWQWRSGTSGAWTDGPTTTTYALTQNSAGTWQVRCQVTRQGVSATSNVVTTVWSVAPQPPPPPPPGPDDSFRVEITRGTKSGTDRTYTAAVIGAPGKTVQYTWSITGNGGTIPGTTTGDTIAVEEESSGSYDVTVEAFVEDTGPQGARGIAGPIGGRGAAGGRGGSGPPGGQGLPGLDGLPGLQGLTGGPGSRGPAGSAGPTGGRGAAGLPGPPGAAGDPGSGGGGPRAAPVINAASASAAYVGRTGTSRFPFEYTLTVNWTLTSVAEDPDTQIGYTIEVRGISDGQVGGYYGESTVARRAGRHSGSFTVTVYSSGRSGSTHSFALVAWTYYVEGKSQVASRQVSFTTS